MIRSALTLATVCLVAACAPADPRVGFEARLTEVNDAIVEVRRDIHRHPEVSGAEERTAGLVADRLRALGLDVRTGVGGHGVVGVLTGSQPGPIVAFRADMDAVPSDAPDPVAFASETPGVRHICGHDVHTAIGLALAEGLAAVRARLPGTVVFIFQPAEENATGARAMIADGLFDEPKPEAIFTVHSAPLSLGQIATAETVLMPGRDLVTVTVEGTRNVVRVAQEARHLLEETGTIASEQAFGAVAGDFVFAQVGNPVLDGSAWVVRAFLTISSDAERARLKQALVPALEALGTPTTRVAVTYSERVIAGVTNDPALVSRATASARRVLGDDGVMMLQQMTPAFSEDFGSLQSQVPGVMFFLGVSNPDGSSDGMPHSPNFVADERAIGVGARAMGAILIDYLTAAGVTK